MSSTKLSSHSWRNAKLRPNSKRKLSSSDAAESGNVIETHEQKGDFKEPQSVDRGRDARQQSTSFARWNQSLRHKPQLHPALLRLSAIISQYFTAGAFTDYSGPFAMRGIVKA
jgi:hypothetical protein